MEIENNNNNHHHRTPEPPRFEFRFSEISLLGEGTYGKVMKCREIATGQIVAVKKIKDVIFQGDGFPSSSIREISILKKLKHPNIVSLKETQFMVDESSLMMVFEFMECDLKQYIDSLSDPLPPLRIKKIMYQLLKGVDFCHSRQVLHRDLKPQNILMSMTSNGEPDIKISDFGLARTFQTPMDRYTKEIATLWYRAPEIMLGDENYSISIDVWAIGCIFIELFTKRPLFRGDSQIDQIFRIFQLLGTPSEATYTGLSKLPDYNEKFPKFNGAGIKSVLENHCKDPLAIDLMEKLLAIDPQERLFCREALAHPYFAEIARSN